MPRNVVVLLSTEEGRALVRRKCRQAGLKLPLLESLVDAELDQTGKQRKAGMWEAFDDILDEPEPAGRDTKS
jgi:hypothetical protein